MTAIIECRHLRVQRDGCPVLDVDDLVVEDGETLAVIGPNGTGKSTLLLTLAGLLPYHEGEIHFRQQLINIKDNLAYRRRIALVLQAPLLLDASVKDNVAAGLRFRHLPRVEVEQRVDEWLTNLGVAHLRDRSARRLSGGEAQRVSLARAFVLHPDVLLLDEPFSALDTPTRIRLLEDLHLLLRQTCTTTFFVTHDLDEALLLGDRVAVLLDGCLRQVGTPRAVFAAPSDADVAAFVGVETILPAVITRSIDGLLEVEAGGQCLRAIGSLPVGQTVYCCLRPEDVTLENCSQSFLSGDLSSQDDVTGGVSNHLTGHVIRITPQGPLERVALDCGFPLVALITRFSKQQIGLREGQDVCVTFDARVVHLLPHDDAVNR